MVAHSLCQWCQLTNAEDPKLFPDFSYMYVRKVQEILWDWERFTHVQLLSSRLSLLHHPATMSMQTWSLIIDIIILDIDFVIIISDIAICQSHIYGQTSIIINGTWAESWWLNTSSLGGSLFSVICWGRLQGVSGRNSDLFSTTMSSQVIKDAENIKNC